jgi:hypothetical protein
MWLLCRHLRFRARWRSSQLHDNLMLVGGIIASGGCLIAAGAAAERYMSLAAFERCVARAAAKLL